MGGSGDVSSSGGAGGPPDTPGSPPAPPRRKSFTDYAAQLVEQFVALLRVLLESQGISNALQMRSMVSISVDVDKPGLSM